MIYLPRYNEWISNREADLNKLPEHLLMLISSFQSTLDSWENAAEEDQAKYMKILRSTDAYISAMLSEHFGDSQNTTTEDDKLKALISKAADLDF